MRATSTPEADSYQEFASETPDVDAVSGGNSGADQDWMKTFAEERDPKGVGPKPPAVSSALAPAVSQPAPPWVRDLPVQVRLRRWWFSTEMGRRAGEMWTNPPGRFVAATLVSWGVVVLVGSAAAAYWMRDRTPALIEQASAQSQPAPAPTSSAAFTPPVVAPEVTEISSGSPPAVSAVDPAPAQSTASAATADAGANTPTTTTKPAPREVGRPSVPSARTTDVPGSVAAATVPGADRALSPAPVSSSYTSLPALALAPPPPVEIRETPIEPRPSAAAMEASAVRSVLEEYRKAFSSLSSARVRAFWPTVNVKTLQRAFDQVQSQEFAFSACEIEVRGDRAQASCDGTAKFVPKIGRQTPVVQPWSWTFYLSRAEGSWTIDSLESRSAVR